jgi:hypothetical protein
MRGDPWRRINDVRGSGPAWRRRDPGPGNYGRKLVVANGATLALSGGTYCFQEVKTGRKATISVDKPSNITVRR